MNCDGFVSQIRISFLHLTLISLNFWRVSGINWAGMMNNCGMGIEEGVAQYDSGLTTSFSSLSIMQITINHIVYNVLVKS